jgi:iron complex outermembrane recepter protein
MRSRGMGSAYLTRLVCSAAVIALVPAGPALAQDAQGAEEGEVSENEVVVIGTRRTDRSSTNSPSPVDVISAADLNAQPASNMLDAVKNVVPSFFVGQNSISDASTFVRAPSLRGLPSDQVLVMMNGKRFNRSALVQVYNGGDTGLSFGSHGADIGVIPSLAIGNLEVLRDGATAQYGSDAIAGVLNYGLRKDAGFEVVGRYGQYYEGDGTSYQISGYAGFKLGDRGFISLTGEYFDDGQTSRGETRPTAAAIARDFPNLAAQLPHYPLPAQIWGNSPADGYKAVLNSEFELSDSMKFYLFGNLAHSEADQSFNYRPNYPGSPLPLLERFDGTTTTTGPAGVNGNFSNPYYLTNCPAGSATCLAGGVVQDANIFNLSSLYPVGFTPRFVGEVDQVFGVAGIKGDSGKLTYDLAVSASKAQLALSMYDSISFSYGPQSQTSFEFGKLIQEELNANLDLTYAIETGLASPLTLSGGLEYRKEKFTQTEGDVQSYGAGPFALARPLYTQTSPGVYALVGTSTDCTAAGAVCTVARAPGASGYGGTSSTYAGSNSEASYGGYIGLEGDITEQLTFGIAGRYEHYESFGDAWVGKINAIYEISDAFSIRGTLGTGYHAPSPGQNNTQILTTNFVAGNAIQTGTYPVTSAVAQFYGGKPLSPEESLNYGLGFVVKPSSAMTLTVDFYRIKVTDRIFISRTFTVSAADIIALPELAGVGEGGDVQYFTNSLDTVTKGVDVVGTYRTNVGDGKLNLTLAYNYNKNKVTNFDPLAISNAQIDVAENLAPKHRLNLQAAYTIGNFGLNLAGRYYSSWRAETDYPGQTFGAKITADAEVSYTFMDHFTLSVGANNLFDTYPDRIKASPSNPIFSLTNSTADGQVYPRMGGPFGFNGGFWYGRIKIKY